MLSVLLFFLFRVFCNPTLKKEIDNISIKFSDDYQFTIPHENFENSSPLKYTIENLPSWMSNSSTKKTEIGKASLNGYTYDVYTDGELALIAAGTFGVVIANVTDKSNPRIVGSIIGAVDARGLFFDVENSLLYVGDWEKGLKIFKNVSRWEFEFVSQVYIGGREMGKVKKKDCFVYISTDIGLYKFDVSDVNNPSYVGFYYNVDGVKGFDIVDDLAFLTTYQSDDLVILNLTKSISGPSCQSYDMKNTVYDVFVKDSIVYVGLRVFGGSVGTLRAYRYDGTCNLEFLYISVDIPDRVKGIAVNDGIGFLAIEDKGLYIGNLSNTSSRLSSLDYTLPGSGLDDAESIFYLDGFVYVSSERGGLVIIDVSDIFSPTLASRIRTISIGSHISFSDGIFFVNKPELRAMSIINGSDFSNPTVISHYGVSDRTSSTRNFKNYVNTSSNLAYVTHASGFDIVDISDKKKPNRLSTFSTSSSVQGISVKENVVYIVSDDDLIIVDVSNKYSPSQISWNTTGNGETLNDVILYSKDGKEYALVCGNGTRMSIFNVTIKTHPEFVIDLTIDSNYKCSSLSIQGNYVYVGLYSFSFTESPARMINIADIQNPVLEGAGDCTVSGSERFEDVVVSGNYLFLADDFFADTIIGGGFYIMEQKPGVSCLEYDSYLGPGGKINVGAVISLGNYVAFTSEFGMYIFSLDTVKLSGTPGESNCGKKYEIKVVATDYEGYSVSTYYNITVDGRLSGALDEECNIYSCGRSFSNESNPCNGGGTCDLNTLSCVCNSSYFGENCEVTSCNGIFNNDTNTTSDICGGHGSCVQFDNCTCFSDYSGLNCSIFTGSNSVTNTGASTGGGSNGLVIALSVVGGVSVCSFITLVLLLLVCVLVCCALVMIFFGILCFVCIILFCFGCGTAGGVVLMKNGSSDFTEMDNIPGHAKLEIKKNLFEIDFDSVRLIEDIGSGGGGAEILFPYLVVYKAEWNRQIVAVKLFRRSGFEEDQNFNEFEREVSVMASVSHPNLLRWYGCTTKPPKIGIVMEFCENGDLSFCLQKGNIETLENKIRVLKEIASGMGYLHSREIIHRDLKPQNVLLDRNLQSKIMDFGLSRILSAKENMTKRIGTSFFMAPEITLGLNYGLKVDVFAYSVIIFIVLTCKVLPYGETPYIELKVANDPLVRPKMSEEEIKKFENLSWLLELMKNGWKHKEDERPSFEEILDVFDKSEKET